VPRDEGMASQRTLEETPEGPGTMRTTLEPVRLLHRCVLQNRTLPVFAWRHGGSLNHLQRQEWRSVLSSS